MKTTSIRARTLACALLATTATCGLTASPACAQTASSSPFPVRQYPDENGVDLLSGAFTARSYEVQIGDGRSGLSFQQDIRQGLYNVNLLGTIDISSATYTVAIGSASEQFTLQTGGSFLPTEARGSSLAYNATNSTYTYTKADGTTATFIPGNYSYGNAKGIALSSIVYPSGKRLDFFYTVGQYVAGNPPSGPVYSYGRRLQSVTSNTGYHIKLSYEMDTILGPGNVPNWSHMIKAMGLNSLVDSCSTSAGSCAASTPRPSLTMSPIGTSWIDYTDTAGNTTRYTFGGGGITGIRRPGSASDNVVVGYDANNRVASVAADGVTTTYTYSDASGVRTVTSTRGSGPSRSFTFDLAKSAMLSSQDELGRATQFEYDASTRPTKITAPEGNYVQVAYDSRGNVTTRTVVAKAGSGLSNIVTSASYDTTCTVAVKCNQPNSITDPRGSTTDFTYDTTHGGLLTETAPAPTTGAVRPQIRYSYTRLDQNGAASASGVFMFTGTSQCQTGSSCAGTADEVKTTIAYGGNLLPTSLAVSNGTGTLTATSSNNYDAVGNLLTVDGPLAGTADTVRYRYDVGRHRVGAVSADPDGAGALKHRAARTTFNPIGQVTKVERGTVNSQSDADWAAMSVLEVAETSYDANARPVTSQVSGGGTVYALTQTSYDALGRVDCVAQRMNPSAFASLPTSACTLGTQGSYGADRISKTIYNAAGEVTQVKSALGTADEATVATSTYTNNGKLATVKDGENNLTTFEYDGFDRLTKMRYPSATKGAGTSSTTDYEQPSYDAYGNVTNMRRRDGSNIAFTFDKLDRVTLKNLPGTEPDVTYTYDNLGRATGVSQTGNALTFTYDALGRTLTQAGPQGTITSTYDVAGRRTRIAHPDGFYVDQDYLVTGEVQKIRENGATSGVGVLATFGYDDLGRRSSLTRGNGSVQSYGYDAVSRLSQLTDDPAGTTYDQTLGFSYNPASQITSNTRSNDLFAWTAHGSGTTNSIANGLNQLASWGSVTPSFDTKGNMTSDGAKTFGYSSENLLTTATGGVTLAYDPMKRLYQVAGTSTSRFGYDGGDLIAEYNGSNVLQRRFVHGPGADAPLVWYEGSGTTDRRFLHADERGSVVAVSNGSGTVTNLNTYDEYGAPAATNVGRFQYTGQKWLGELGLYDYKARMYHPKVGRFVQADPVGYRSGMNLYSYVAGDPVNRADPSGMIPSLTERAKYAEDGVALQREQAAHGPVASMGAFNSQLANMNEANLDRSQATFVTMTVAFDWVEGHWIDGDAAMAAEPSDDSDDLQVVATIWVPGHYVSTAVPVQWAQNTASAPGDHGNVLPNGCYSPVPGTGSRVCSDTLPGPELTDEQKREFHRRRCAELKTSRSVGGTLAGVGTAMGGAELLGLAKVHPIVRGVTMLAGATIGVGAQVGIWTNSCE